MTEPYMPSMLEQTLENLLGMILSDSNLSATEKVSAIEDQRLAVLDWYDDTLASLGADA